MALVATSAGDEACRRLGVLAQQPCRPAEVVGVLSELPPDVSWIVALRRDSALEIGGRGSVRAFVGDSVLDASDYAFMLDVFVSSSEALVLGFASEDSPPHAGADIWVGVGVVPARYVRWNPAGSNAEPRIELPAPQTPASLSAESAADPEPNQFAALLGETQDLCVHNASVPAALPVPHGNVEALPSPPVPLVDEQATGVEAGYADEIAGLDHDGHTIPLGALQKTAADDGATRDVRNAEQEPSIITAVPAPSAHAVASASVVTPSKMCGDAHANPPEVVACRICGAPLPSELVAVQHPVVGVLVLETGERIPIDRQLVVGRSPRAQGLVSGLPPRLVPIDSPGNDISKTHLVIDVSDWNIVVTDHDSTNGTVLVAPDGMSERLRSRESRVVLPGTKIELAEVVALSVRVV